MGNSKTVQLFPCECGISIEVPKGRVGVPFNCQNCNVVHQIPSLAEMESLASKQISSGDRILFSFSITTLAKLTAVVALMCFAWIKVPIFAEIVLALALAAVAYLLIVLVIGGALLKTPSLVRAFWDRFDSNT